MKADAGGQHVRVDRVVVHAADRTAAERIARRLPETLRTALDGRDYNGAPDVEQLVRGAAREARR